MDLACHCPVPFIEALIAEGGDPCDADAEGRNLACYAAIAGNTELVRHLFSTRACPEDEASWRRLLIAAAEAQHDDGIEIVRWIFQNHDPDDLLDPQTSGHALFNAAASESPLLFRMLLDTGANPLHAPSGLYDAPVLVLVAGWNRHGGDHAPDLVAELIEKGADPAQQDPHSGRDAVLAAVARGRPETLERLIQLGASLDTRDRAGRSPHDILKSHLLIPGSLMERKQTILREAMHSSNGQ